MDKFSDEVCRAVGSYVYRLIDPRNGETFYVGQGVGNRVFDHVRGATDLLNEVKKNSESDADEVSLKFARIRSIQGAGLQVVHVIHRHRIPDYAVSEVEAALIDAFPGLSNVQGGHGSSERGPMHAVEINTKYGLPETVRKPEHKLLLININRSSENAQEANYYESVRYAWRLDVTKAMQMNYVLAIRRGVVLDAFVATEWKPAKFVNFPALAEESNRWGFVGELAPSDIQTHYRSTRLPPDVTHVQNPVRYWLPTVSAQSPT